MSRERKLTTLLKCLMVNMGVNAHLVPPWHLLKFQRPYGLLLVSQLFPTTRRFLGLTLKRTHDRVWWVASLPYFRLLGTSGRGCAT